MRTDRQTDRHDKANGRFSQFCERRPKVIEIYAQLTLRRLMSYIYMEHPFLMFLDHTQRRSTVGRTPLDE